MFNVLLLIICISSLIAVCMIAGSLYHLIDVIEEKIDDMSMLECRIAQILPDTSDDVHADLYDDELYVQSFDPAD